MASVEPYETKAGRRWRVRYRKPDRSQTTKSGFVRKRDAETWLSENHLRLLTGQYTDPRAGKITVDELAQDWLQTKTGITPKTRLAYEHAAKRISRTGMLGQVYVSDVTPALVRRWVADLETTHAPKTVQTTFAVLSQVLRQAVEDHRVHTNPCTGVQLPRVPRNPDQLVLTAQQLLVMADAAGHHRPAVLLMGMAGLRWSEMVGLQRRDVDLETREIHVRRQLANVDGKLVPGLPKHHKTRKVPVPHPLAAALAPLLDGDPTGLVVTSTRGNPLRTSNARRDWFDPAAETAGAPGLTPHNLRTTYVSLAVQAGASVKQVQEACGHHSAAFTLDRYAALFPSDLDHLGRSMDKLFGGQVVATVTNPGGPPE